MILNISPVQLQSLRHKRLERFLDFMQHHVREKFASLVASVDDDLLREMIEAGVDDAEAWGIAIEYDVARFVDLKFLLSLDFDENPEFEWAREILANGHLTPTQRIDAIWRCSALD